MLTQKKREKNNALLLSQQHMRKISREAFIIGGGLANTTSLLELMNTIGELHGHAPGIRFADWPTADEQFYVSDTHRFIRATGWVS
jgi:CDP-paratose 2-epimerase